MDGQSKRRAIAGPTHENGGPITLVNRKIMAVRQVSQSQAAVTPSNSG